MESPDTLEIKDINHFVGLLSRWHQRKVAILNHMLTVPEDAEVMINEAEPVKMTGEFRKGFELGVSIALSELGELPFVAEMEESDSSTKH